MMRTITPARYKANAEDRELADKLMARAGVPPELCAYVDVWDTRAVVWSYDQPQARTLGGGLRGLSPDDITPIEVTL